MSKELLISAVRGATQGSTGWWRVNCPFCAERTGKDDKRQSCGVHSGGGFHCFRCGVAGRVKLPSDLDYGGTVVAPEKAEEEDIVIEPPYSFMPLATGDGFEAESFAPARNYLRGRGISRKTVHEAGIGGVYSGFYAKRIVVPIRDAVSNNWVGFIARDWTDTDDQPYLNSKGLNRGTMLFNHEALFVETDEPLLIVEGMFDALPYWPHATACLGKPTHEQTAAFMAANRPLAICLDGDAHRIGDSLATLLRFEGRRAGYVRLPPRKDPNTVDPNWLRQRAHESIREGDGTSC